MTIVHLDDEDVTVGELIASWAERVKGIAIETMMLSEGVEGKITSHDYIGFLHFRSILDSALRPVGLVDKSPEQAILDAIDSCFKSLTEPDQIGWIEAVDPLLADPSKGERWWTKRVPRRGALGCEIARAERYMRAKRPGGGGIGA